MQYTRRQNWWALKGAKGLELDICCAINMTLFKTEKEAQFCIDDNELTELKVVHIKIAEIK